MENVRDIILIVLQVIGLICLVFWVFFLTVWYVHWYFFTSKEDSKKINEEYHKTKTPFRKPTGRYYPIPGFPISSYTYD